MQSYDSWLEAQYQRELEQAEAYEAALEAETERQREQLEAMTLENFTRDHDTITCKLSDITTGPYRADGRVSIDLDSLFSVLAEQLAVAALAEPLEVDEPDDAPEVDLDCDYWRNLK